MTAAERRLKAQIVALRPLLETEDEAAAFTSGLAAGILIVGVAPEVTSRFALDYSAFIGDDDGATLYATIIKILTTATEEVP